MLFVCGYQEVMWQGKEENGATAKKSTLENFVFSWKDFLHKNYSYDNTMGAKIEKNKCNTDDEYGLNNFVYGKDRKEKCIPIGPQNFLIFQQDHEEPIYNYQDDFMRNGSKKNATCQTLTKNDNYTLCKLLNVHIGKTKKF
jgi:hypothetical protein